MEPILYKYRGILNFRYFIDILLKNRLFAAKYSDLNDPMDGQYYYSKGELNEDIVNKLSDGKDKLRICSLSRKNNNELLWSHYSEGHRGVVIGVQIDRQKYDVRRIDYTGLATISGIIKNNTPRNILSHKLNVWSYEQEERAFVTDAHYINVSVKEVITGRKMSNQDFSFIRELLEKINPEINLIKAETFM